MKPSNRIPRARRPYGALASLALASFATGPLAAQALAAQAAPKAAAGAAQAVVSDAFQDEFKELDKAWRAARAAYQKGLKAKYEERQKSGAGLTAEDLAGDPADEYRERFREFAQYAKGTESGAKALVTALELSRGQPNLALVDEVIDTCANFAAVERAAGLIASLSWQLGSEAVEGKLRKLIETTKLLPVQAAATYQLGSLLMNAESVPGQEPSPTNSAAREAEAKKLLALVAEKYAETKYAAQAKGALFELEHLVIGKAPPDFEAVDENGKAWKLSDYRGKVVVVDFWGHW
jgi:hypothetical protein